MSCAEAIAAGYAGVPLQPWRWRAEQDRRTDVVAEEVVMCAARQIPTSSHRSRHHRLQVLSNVPCEVSAHIKKKGKWN
jgi:hypothetical protein